MTYYHGSLGARRDAVLADLDVPVPPGGDLAEFGPRWAAAMRAVLRYASAVAAVSDQQAGFDRLRAAWPDVRLRLERVRRLCEIGLAGKAKRRRGSRGPTNRQRTLHQTHRALLNLENVVDKAVATSIAFVLAAEEPDSTVRRADVDIWVRALTDALREMDGIDDD